MNFFFLFFLLLFFPGRFLPAWLTLDMQCRRVLQMRRCGPGDSCWLAPLSPWGMCNKQPSHPWHVEVCRSFGAEFSSRASRLECILCYPVDPPGPRGRPGMSQSGWAPHAGTSWLVVGQFKSLILLERTPWPIAEQQLGDSTTYYRRYLLFLCSAADMNDGP